VQRYFGGDLEGIVKSAYLASLGITALYLNPIFEAHSTTVRHADTPHRSVLGREGLERSAPKRASAATRAARRVFSHTRGPALF
jgi:hypothetical protein